jgi:PAS domain S-box-containing protein
MKDENKTKIELIKELEILREEREKGVFKDITERKRAEKELKDSEEHLKILFDYSPDAYYISDLKGNFIDGNKAAERLVGYKKEELIGKNFLKLKLLSLTDILKAAKLLAKNLRRRPTGPDEFVLNRKDNSKVTIEISTYPVKIKGRALALGIARDITGRKQAEQALKKSEEKYRSVFENTGTATIIIEEDKIISMVNTQSEKMYGYSKEEIENKMKWTDFVIPEDLERMKKYHIARRKTGEKAPTEYEFRLIDKEGNIRDIFLKIGMIPNTKKSVASLMDITERKKAEQNIKSAKDALQMIMDSVPAIIFYKDTEGRIIRANKTLADSLKVPVKDIVGKTTEELFPKEQAENMRKDDQEVIISGKPKRDIIEPYDTSEGTRWAISDKIPYKDKEGKVTGVIDLSKDITVQRKAEQELKQAYQKLKKTMDATIDTMSRIIEAKDPYTSGHQHRVCQLAVPLARDLGLSPDKIEGIRISSLIHDIGKIGLPAAILNKPSKLTDIEFSLIKSHSQLGYDILKSIDFSYPIANIVLQHHEKIDGSGYPNHLKGDEILLEAKIICVADVVEAMSSHRPYRPAFGIDVVLKEITKNRGTLYDPKVVDACLRLFKEKGFKFE